MADGAAPKRKKGKGGNPNLVAMAKTGRPKAGEEHPREEYSAKIKLMSAIGIPQAQIAGVLKMSLETLHNKYRDELDFGSGEANTVVGGRIFEAAKRGESWACSLWAARRMGWKESTDINLAGANGGPIQTVNVGHLNAQQLEALATIRIPADDR